MDTKQKEITDKIRQKVENNSNSIQEIVDEIIKPYCEELDNYVDFIKSILKDEKNPPTAMELDDFCINLSTFLYYAGGMQERLGIKDDIARAVYKEVYNLNRDSLEKGTVADKDSLAELASQQEALVSMAYKRAYGIMKAKVSAGQELLGSVKKIISRRMAEAELTKIGGNR